MGRMVVKTPKKHPPVLILTLGVKSNTRKRVKSNSINKLSDNETTSSKKILIDRPP